MLPFVYVRGTPLPMYSLMALAGIVFVVIHLPELAFTDVFNIPGSWSIHGQSVYIDMLGGQRGPIIEMIEKIGMHHQMPTYLDCMEDLSNRLDPQNHLRTLPGLI